MSCSTCCTCVKKEWPRSKKHNRGPKAISVRPQKRNQIPETPEMLTTKKSPGCIMTTCYISMQLGIMRWSQSILANRTSNLSTRYMYTMLSNMKGEWWYQGYLFFTVCNLCGSPCHLILQLGHGLRRGVLICDLDLALQLPDAVLETEHFARCHVDLKTQGKEGNHEVLVSLLSIEMSLEHDEINVEKKANWVGWLEQATCLFYGAEEFLYR